VVLLSVKGGIVVGAGWFTDVRTLREYTSGSKNVVYRIKNAVLKNMWSTHKCVRLCSSRVFDNGTNSVQYPKKIMCSSQKCVQ